MKMRSLIYLFGFVFLLLKTITAMSQEEEKMTLEDLIHYGLKHHRSLKNEAKTIEYQRWQTKIRQSAYLPNIHSSADYRRNTNLPVSVLPGDAFGQQDTPLEIQMGTKNAIQAGIDIRQSVYDPVKYSRIRQSEFNTELAKNQFDMTRKQVAISIKQAYFRLIYHQEVLHTSVRNLDAYSQLADINTTAMDTGLISREELDESLQKRTNEKLEKEINELNVQNALKRLKQAMDYPGKDSLKIQLQTVSEIIISHKPVLLDSFNYEKNNEYQALNIQLDLNRERRKEILAGYRPVINTYGFIGTQYYDDEFNPFQHEVKWYRHSYLGLHLELPVFEGLLKKRQRHSNKIQGEKLDLQKTRLASDLKKREKILQKSVLIARKRADLRKNEYQLATSSYETAIENYERGLRDYQYVLQTEMDRNMKEQAYLNALLEVLNSILEYEELTAQY